MKIAYVQTSPVLGDVKGNVKRAFDLIRPHKADLFVLPELFNSGYLITDKSEMPDLAEAIPGGYTSKAVMDLAKQKNAHVVAGILEEADGKYYNSAILAGPKGYIGTYRKIHLFYEEKLFFEPGDRPFEVYDIGKCRLGLMICYDWIYPESMRVMALKGAQVIAHAANLVMPFCPDIMPSRCFDNRVFAVTSNRVGFDEKNGKRHDFIGLSQIVSQKGEVIKRSGEKQEETGIADIDPAQADNKRLNEHNDLFEDRRMEMYEELVREFRPVR